MPRASASKSKRATAPAKGKDAPGGSLNLSTDDAVYFFRPKEDHGYLSQWYPSTFTEGTYTYENAEQYMMHRKGILFAPDSPVTSAILETTNPRDIKALGRKIPNFDDIVWKRERMGIVTQGSRLKFKQNEDMKAQLLATGERELVEASPFDKIWGVGFNAKQAPSKRGKWGANLLGKALMAVRKEFQEENASDGAGPVGDAPVLNSRSEGESNQDKLV